MKLTRRKAITAAIAAACAPKVETVFGFVQSQLEKRKLKAWTSRLNEHVHPSPDGPAGPPVPRQVCEDFFCDLDDIESGEFSGLVEQVEEWRNGVRVKRVSPNRILFSASDVKRKLGIG